MKWLFDCCGPRISDAGRTLYVQTIPETLVMQSLYELLGIQTNCDAGKVKAAFRNAVKVNHPDVNIDDPEAPTRFRNIVRARNILSDPELRAVYDRMLEFERRQLHPGSRLAAMRDATHIVVLAVVLAGAFSLFTYIPEASVSKVKVAEDAAHQSANARDVQAPPTTDASAANKSGGVKASAPSAVAPTTSSAVAIEDAAPTAAPAATTAQESANVGNVQPPPTTGASVRDKSEDVQVSAPSAIAPTTSSAVAAEDAAPAVAPTATAKVIETIHSDGLTPSLPVKDAVFYREKGIAAYRNGDVSLAIADFDVAIRLDPNFKSAYIDRSIAFYRMKEFSRAFADVAQAMRIENSHRIATSKLPKASPSSIDKHGKSAKLHSRPGRVASIADRDCQLCRH
jgi:curved DNA-binding protein CbpA